MPRPLLAFAAALATALAACAGDRPIAVRGVLLVTVPRDESGLAQLGAKAVYFEDALTPSPLALPAHASLITGLDPREHGVRDNGMAKLKDPFMTLAERFTALGYRARAVASSSDLGTGTGLDQGSERSSSPPHHDPLPVVIQPHRWGAEPAVELALTELDELVAGDTPFLLEVFLSDTGRDTAGERLTPLVDGITARGLWSQLTVIVTSHGPPESVLDLAESNLRVPLLIRHPDFAPARVSGPVSLIDVVPTVLGLIGAPADAEALPGLDLAPYMRDGALPSGRVIAVENAAPLLRHGWVEHQGVIRDELKLVRTSALVLQDRQADPHAEHNLYRRKGDLRSKNMLQALELIFGKSAAAQRDPADAPARTEYLADLASIDSDILAGRFGPAISSLEEVVLREPRSSAALYRLAALQLAPQMIPSATLARAEAQVDRALVVRGEDVLLLHLKAVCARTRARHLKREFGAAERSENHQRMERARAEWQSTHDEYLDALRAVRAVDPTDTVAAEALVMALILREDSDPVELEELLSLVPEDLRRAVEPALGAR